MNKFYEEKAKKLGKKLLIEEASISIASVDIEHFSNSKLVESQGNTYEALAIVKNVPVSGYTENANGRKYPRALWEKVFKEKVFEGTCALADHPEGEGSVKDIWGIWREMEVRDDGVYGTLYLVEEKPVRILRASGKLGLSSVGYGELDESNTVKPESYELERLADIVFNPSQGTYMKAENLQENVNNNSLFKESVTNKCNNKIEENKLEEQYTMLKETVNIKNNIRVILKEAKANKKSIKEAIDDIKFWQENTPLEEKELHTYINNSISELSEKMEAEISNANKSLKEKEISFEELKTKFKVLETTLADVTERYKKAQSIIESGGVDDTKALSENASKMKSDINKLMKERSLMETDISIFTEEVAFMKSDIKVLMNERKDMLSDIKVYENKLTEAEKHIQGLEKILEDEYGYGFEDDFVDDSTILDDGFEKEVIIDGEIYEPKEDDYMLGEEEGDSDIINQEDGSMELGDIGDEMSYAEHYHRKYTEADDEKDADKEKEDKEKKDKEDADKEKEDDLKEADMDDKMAAIRAGKSPDDAKDDEAEKEKDKKDDKKDDDKKDDKKDENIKRLGQNSIQESVKVIPAVAQLFNEALRENKSLNDVKKQILESKSILEASRKIQKFSEVRGNDSVSIGKSKESNNTVEYRFNR